jgi:hypothetical protein
MNKTFGTAIRLIASVMLLAGCAKTYVPIAGVPQANFEQSKAQCSIIARHGGTGFFAAGDPNFVAGAAVGNAVGNAVTAHQDFSDCMTMHGWTAAQASNIIWARKDGQRMTGNPALFQQGNQDKSLCEQRASQTGTIDMAAFNACTDEKGYYRISG